MTDQQKNLEVDKEKRQRFWRKLFRLLVRLIQKESWKLVNAIYCTCFHDYILRIISPRSSRISRMGTCPLVFPWVSSHLFHHCNHSLVEWEKDGQCNNSLHVCRYLFCLNDYSSLLQIGLAFLSSSCDSYTGIDWNCIVKNGD